MLHIIQKITQIFALGLLEAHRLICFISVTYSSAHDVLMILEFKIFEANVSTWHSFSLGKREGIEEVGMSKIGLCNTLCLDKMGGMWETESLRMHLNGFGRIAKKFSGSISVCIFLL